MQRSLIALVCALAVAGCAGPEVAPEPTRPALTPPAVPADQQARYPDLAVWRYCHGVIGGDVAPARAAAVYGIEVAELRLQPEIAAAIVRNVQLGNPTEETATAVAGLCRDLLGLDAIGRR